jgi:hypothetical protein
VTHNKIKRKNNNKFQTKVQGMVLTGSVRAYEHDSAGRVDAEGDVFEQVILLLAYKEREEGNGVEGESRGNE